MQPNFDPLGLGGFAANGMPQMAPPKVQPKKKDKGFLLDQISTVGGIVGGVGGGALGALAGGFGAIPGAAVGAGAGSALGESLENILTGDAWDKNVVKEGALGAVFGGGPLRLLKAGAGAVGAARGAKAAGASLGLKGAIRQGSDEAAGWSATGALGRKLTGKTTDLATNQFGIQGNFIHKFKKDFKEDPGKTLLRYNIGSVDDVAEQITKQNQVFSTLVESAGNIKKSTVQSKFQSLADDLSKLGVPGDKAMAQKIVQEADDLLAQYGDEIPAPVLNSIKSRYDTLAKQSMGQDNNLANLNKRVADGFRQVIQDGTGSKRLKETGIELSKLYNLKDEIGKRAATVANRNSSPLGLRNLMGLVAGGGVGLAGGGPIGGLAGAGLVAAVNSPTGRRMATNAAIKGGDTLQRIGQKTGPLQDTALGTAGRIGGYNSLIGGDGADNTSAATLESALMGQSQSAGSMNNSAMPMMSPAMTPNNMGEQYQESPEMSTAPGNPFGVSREQVGQALFAAMKAGDEPAFEQLQTLYALIDDYEKTSGTAGGGMQDLSQSSRNALASSDNAITTIDQLEGIFSSAGGAGGRLGGSIKNLAGKAGFAEEAKVYNDMANASVTQIAKALAGSGAGTVSDMDAKVIISALPRFNDSPAEAQAKFAALRQRLEAARNNTLLYGGGTSQPATIEDTLTQGALY